MKRNKCGYADMDAIVPIGIIVLVLLAISGLGLVLCAGIGPSPKGYLGQLLLVIGANVGFWIMIGVAILFGLYRKLTNEKEFTWLELPVQLAASTVAIILLFCFFYSTSANMSDTEIWNGYVTQAEYYEAWTERVTHQECKGHDKKGNCKGYRTVVNYVHHPPSWTECTTVDDLAINRELYGKFVRYFGNEKKKNLFRMNQTSSGDGDMYYVTYDGANHEVIPASRPRWFVNYLRASDSIEKIQGSMLPHKELLRPYPEVYYGTFGEIELDRVIDAGVSLPDQWKREVDKTLDVALAELGARKEVNILVYAVKTVDQGFVHALEESWVKGKKNDVIVILGVTEFPKINFAYVMAWTKIEEFRINLRNRILDMKNLDDGKAFAQTIVEEISKSPQEGGFERRPMADLEYLIQDIKLPWWCQILIVIIGGGVSWGVSVLLINNEERS